MALLMFFQAVYVGHFLSLYTMQLEPPKYSLIRSALCSCSTCCFGLGFQLQNLQDFIKISRALIKDIFLQLMTYNTIDKPSFALKLSH